MKALKAEFVRVVTKIMQKKFSVQISESAVHFGQTTGEIFLLWVIVVSWCCLCCAEQVSLSVELRDVRRVRVWEAGRWTLLTLNTTKRKTLLWNCVRCHFQYLIKVELRFGAYNILTLYLH